MRKGGQLELLPLLSTVFGVTWKEAQQKKLSWRSLGHMEPLQISFLLIKPLPITFSIQKLVLQRFTHKIQFRRLFRCTDHVLRVKHRTLRENYAANAYVSPKDIRVYI